jgi:hypothetical protein
MWRERSKRMRIYRKGEVKMFWETEVKEIEV